MLLIIQGEENLRRGSKTIYPLCISTHGTMDTMVPQPVNAKLISARVGSCFERKVFFPVKCTKLETYLLSETLSETSNITFRSLSIVSPSLPLSHSHSSYTHTHTHTHTHKHTQSHTHTQTGKHTNMNTHTPSLSLSLSHTQTQTLRDTLTIVSNGVSSPQLCFTPLPLSYF